MTRVPYIVAKEGFKSIAIAVVVAIILGVLGLCFFAFISMAIAVVLVVAYRDPERVINSDDSALLSMCDGKVYHIETLEDSVLVSIDTSLLNVSLVRAPLDCSVENIQRVYGVNLPTSNIKSRYLNDRVSFDIKNSINMRVELISGMFSNQIDIFDTEKPFKRGDRVALIRDGIVKMYLPKDIRLKVDIGDSIRAGESIVGFLNK
jgi:phosphatidylserine decarboxylase